jgi:hypothetical protein
MWEGLNAAIIGTLRSLAHLQNIVEAVVLTSFVGAWHKHRYKSIADEDDF